MSKTVRLPGAVSVEAEPNPAPPASVQAAPSQDPAPPAAVGTTSSQEGAGPVGEGAAPVAPSEPAGVVAKEIDAAPLLLRSAQEAMAAQLRKAGWRCEPPTRVGGTERPRLSPNGWEVPSGYGA